MDRSDRSRAVLIALFLLVLGVSISASVPAVVAQPVISDPNDGTKTVTWDFAASEDYAVSDVDVAPGALSLRRLDSSWVYDPVALGSIGVADQTVTINGSLRLKGNDASLISNGNFEGSTGWTFTNSSSGAVLASPGSGKAHFLHASPRTASQFDSMDAVMGSWTSAGSGGGALPFQEGTVVHEGTGSAKALITLTNSSSWAGIEKATLSPWNFLPYNEVSVWLTTEYGGPGQLSASLNLRTAGAEWNSTPVAMTTAWELAVFDISGFGTNLNSIIRVQLRFTGVGVTDQAVYIDDVWQAYFKATDESASIEQTFYKSTSNSGTPWSALLVLDDMVTEISYIAELELGVTVQHLSGPSAAWSTRLGSVGNWTTRTINLAPAMKTPGSYTITITLRVEIATNLATSAAVSIDNVRLLSPDYADGAYTSEVLSPGSSAIWQAVSWKEVTDDQTEVLTLLRTGGTQQAGDSSWVEWTTHSDASGEAILSSSNPYLQFQVRLTTSNSSRTPELSELRIEFTRYTPTGTLTTKVFSPEKLIRWRSFDASAIVPPSTAVAFEISEDGVVWQRATPDSSLDAVSESTLQVRAILSSTNTSRSPQLLFISITYEFEGELTVIRLCVQTQSECQPSSTWRMKVDETVQFTAVGYDAHSHAVSFTPIWETTELGADVPGGRYTPRSIGTYVVRAYNENRTVAGEITLSVDAAALPLWALLGWPWSGLAIAAAAAIVLVWEAYFRYPHRLEDVFVIARDGRLVVHKTRRLRADRDEDIFAGMLAAIMAFVRDSFKEEKKELDHFGFGDRTVYVERGEFGYVAAIYSGTPPPWVRKNLTAFVADLELSHGEMIRDWSGDRDEVSEIQSMTESFVGRRRYAPLWGQIRSPKAS